MASGFLQKASQVRLFSMNSQPGMSSPAKKKRAGWIFRSEQQLAPWQAVKKDWLRSVEDAVGTSTGDKIAGATGSDVKLRPERKLGGSAEALAPHRLDSVFIRFGGPQGHAVSVEDALLRGRLLRRHTGRLWRNGGSSGREGALRNCSGRCGLRGQHRVSRRSHPSGLQYAVGVQSSTTVWAPGKEPLPARPRGTMGRPPRLLQRTPDTSSLPHTPNALRRNIGLANGLRRHRAFLYKMARCPGNR
jgi:hypothetical protein